MAEIGYMKLCGRCGFFRDYETEFGWSDREHTKRLYNCKQCYREMYNQRWRKKCAKIVRTWRKPAPSGYAHCTKCNEVKLTTEFFSHRGRKDGLAVHCKTCMGEAQKQSRGGWCECGRRKTVERPACERCLPFVGLKSGEARLVDVIRDRWVSGLFTTTDDLASETGYTKRSVLRLGAQLEEAGVLRRSFVDEHDTGRVLTYWTLLEGANMIRCPYCDSAKTRRVHAEGRVWWYCGGCEQDFLVDETAKPMRVVKLADGRVSMKPTKTVSRPAPPAKEKKR